MSDHPIVDAAAPPRSTSASVRRAGPGSLRRGLLGLVAAPLALGAAGPSRAQSESPPIAPTAIGSLTTSGGVAARGEVAEIYGNKFIVQDGTGRALVETGPRGEDGTLVRRGETVTVQGRFEHGFLHAALIIHPDGRQVRLGPAGGPPPGGPGGLAWIRDRVGLGPRLDVPALTATVERAGYSDVRVTGRGPRHLEVAAKGRDGGARALHVDVDGTIRER